MQMGDKMHFRLHQRQPRASKGREKEKSFFVAFVPTAIRVGSTSFKQ